MLIGFLEAETHRPVDSQSAREGGKVVSPRQPPR